MKRHQEKTGEIILNTYSSHADFTPFGFSFGLDGNLVGSQVPENQRMNAEKKRRQMFLLEDWGSLGGLYL